MIRAALRVLALLAFTLFCVVCHLTSRLLSGRSRWPRRYLAGAGRIVGLDVRIAGVPLDRDVFFIANHVSWADILALGGASGCAFVAMAELGHWPLIGWLAAQNGTILVDRAGRGAVREQIAAVRAAMHRHQPLALFPEGTTGDGQALLPFKPTLFAVLMPPPRDIRVQPVFIDYGPAAADIAWTGAEGAPANARRLLSRRGRLPVTLHFLPPLHPGDHADRKQLASQVRGALEVAMRSFASPPPIV